MKPEDFSSTTAGKPIKNPNGYWFFTPASLPPELQWTGQFVSLVGEAERALAEFSAIGRAFPKPNLLTRSFVRQEAVMSSRIEGTQASLEDIYHFEGGQSAATDTREVHNYVTALEYGISRLDTLPVSLRLIRELHEKLMQGVRGDMWTPGEFRRTQNWIGPAGSTLETAAYVPPPAEEMIDALNKLEQFVHEYSEIPPIVRVGLIHYQFEAIHPFLDGNGRVGRLLVILLLYQWGLLPQPILYLSNYFEKYRSEYYARLLEVSQRGKWQEWLTFFLTAIRDQSREAALRIQSLQALQVAYYEKLANQRSNAPLLRLVDFLFEHPIVTIKQVQDGLELTDYKAAQRYILKFQEIGIVSEVTGKSRNRLYRANEIMRAIEESI